MFEWIKEKFGIVDDSGWGTEYCDKKIAEKKKKKEQKPVVKKKKEEPPKTKVEFPIMEPKIATAKMQNFLEKTSSPNLAQSFMTNCNVTDRNFYRSDDLSTINKDKLSIGELVFDKGTGTVYVKTSTGLEKIAESTLPKSRIKPEEEKEKIEEVDKVYQEIKAVKAKAEHSDLYHDDPVQNKAVYEKIQEINEEYQNNYLNAKDAYEQKQKEEEFIKNCKNYGDPIRIDLT